MYTAIVAILVVLIVVAFALLVSIMSSWRGRCPSCRSFQYWNYKSVTSDVSKPNTVTVHLENKCCKCSYCVNLGSKERIVH